MVHRRSHDTVLCFLADDLPGCFWQPHVITPWAFFRAWCVVGMKPRCLCSPALHWYVHCAGLLPSEFSANHHGSTLDSFPNVYLFLLRRSCFEVATTISDKLIYFQVCQQTQEDQMTNGSAWICKSASFWLFFIFPLICSLAMESGLFYWQIESICNCMQVGNVAQNCAEDVGCFAGIFGQVH